MSKKMAETRVNVQEIQSIGAIIGIIGCIGGVIMLALLWFNDQSKEPDFTLYIAEKNLSVSHETTLQSSIIIKSVFGYKRNVNLSANVLPPDVIIEFVSPFGEPIPTYSSTMKIHVGLNAPSGEHAIKITGTGSDGKERYCEFILSIFDKSNADSSKTTK